MSLGLQAKAVWKFPDLTLEPDLNAVEQRVQFMLKEQIPVEARTKISNARFTNPNFETFSGMLWLVSNMCYLLLWKFG